MGSLAALIRERVAGDDGLRALHDELKAHLYRGIAWWDDARLRHAASRLRRLMPGVPKLIRPADYTRDGVEAAYGGEPYYPHAHDFHAAMKAHRLRHRLALLLATLFDPLRTGEAVATGRPVADPTSPVDIPAELWADGAAAVEWPSGDVLVGTVRVYRHRGRAAGAAVPAAARGDGARVPRPARPTARADVYRG